MPVNNKLGVIFDMDGVVVDSAEVHFEAFKELGKKLGKPFTREMLTKTAGMHNNQIFPLWLGDDLSHARVIELGSEKEALYRSMAKGRLKPIPGVLELLQLLRNADIPIAVGSSGPKENVALALSVLKIADFFNAIVTGSDVTHGKPNPEIFLKSAQKLNLPPHSCIVIEDAEQGVKAARNAGMRVIAVTTTTPRESLLFADLVVDSLSELHTCDFLYS